MHIEYVPTQIVAEYFRHISRNSDKSRLDGILYSSSVVPKGICVALFCRNEDCTDGPTAEGKTLALVNVKREPANVQNFQTAEELFAKEIEKMKLPDNS